MSGVCTSVVCDSGRLPININATAWGCSGNVTYQTVCTANCTTNFTGSLNATCGSDGSWQGPFGQCTRLCTFDDLPDLFSTVPNATTTSLGRRRLLVSDEIVWTSPCVANTTTGAIGSLPGQVCTANCPSPQEGTVTSVCGHEGVWNSTKNCTAGGP
jgi:hypothetical protein